jgi:predicted RNase H-like nuclease (RuvC/YqgF family)
MDTNAKTLFEESIKGLQGSFHSLWTEGEDLSKKLSAINERVNELSATTLEANQEVTSVNKLSAFKEYDRQIVELTKQVEHLEKVNNKLKEQNKETETVEEYEFNSGGEQPPPDMPVADKEESGDEEDDEEEGEEYVYKGETYWMMDEKLYKFVSETEIEEEPCGVIVNKKPKLF